MENFHMLQLRSFSYLCLDIVNRCWNITNVSLHALTKSIVAHFAFFLLNYAYSCEYMKASLQSNQTPA